MSLTRRNALKTIFWSALTTGQYFFKNIFFISFFLKYYNGQDYGFWIILMSFYAMTVYVCDGYVRYCLNEYNLHYYKDKNTAMKFFRDGFTFLILCNSVILSLLLVFIHYIPLSVTIFNTSASIVKDHALQYCLFIIIFISLAHCTVKYLSGAIEPGGHIHVSNRYIGIYTLSETLVYFVSVFFLLSFSKIFLVLFLVLMVINVVYLVHILRKYSVYRQGVWGNLRQGAILFLRSLFFIANNFFEKLTLDGINFMIAMFYPPMGLLPIYASNRTMANVMVSASNTIVGVFTIEFQRLSMNKETDRLMKMLHALWFIAGICINFGLVFVFPWLIRMYVLWTQGKIAVHLAFFYLIFSMVLLNVYGMVIILYLKSLNYIKQLFPISLFRAALIFLMMVFLPRLPISIAISLLVAEFIVNVILLNIVLYREAKRMTGQNISTILFINVLPFVLMAVYMPLNGLLNFDPILSMVSMAAILGAVYAIQLRYMKNDLLAANLRFVFSKMLPGIKRKP